MTDRLGGIGDRRCAFSGCTRQRSVRRQLRPSHRRAARAQDDRRHRDEYAPPPNRQMFRRRSTHRVVMVVAMSRFMRSITGWFRSASQSGHGSAGSKRYELRRRIGRRSPDRIASRHSAANPQNRDRSTISIGRHQRIFAGRRFDPRLLVARLPRNRQRVLRILDVDHARHKRAACRQLQLVLRQLDRNRKAKRQARRRIESIDELDRRIDFDAFVVRNVGNLQSVHGTDLHADESVVRLRRSKNHLPKPVRSEHLAALGSAPAGSTLTTVRPAQVVGCQSLPEAWHRHLASALVAPAPRPLGPTQDRPVLPIAVCPRLAFAVANARAPAPLSWEISCKCCVCRIGT